MAKLLGAALALLATTASAFTTPKSSVATRALRRKRAAAAPTSIASLGPAAPRRGVALYAAGDDVEQSKTPWFLDPGTYGGVIVLTIALIVGPLLVYAALTATGMDSNQVGVALSGIFVAGGIVLWTASYIFRVFSKNMTYSTQLKQYEDAVIQKRFEELEDDEVEALLGEMERD